MTTEPNSNEAPVQSRCYAGVAPPDAFIEKFQELRRRNKYANRWTLKLVKQTNRYPETNGCPWGWYEVFPLGIDVRHWSSEKDDLRDCDIAAWNARAAELSA